VIRHLCDHAAIGVAPAWFASKSIVSYALVSDASAIGGGSPTAPGFGPSSSLAWVLNNQSSCNVSVTIDLGDGPEFVGGFVVPC
jgi:hypothetical protein